MDLKDEVTQALNYGLERLACELHEVIELANLGSGHVGYR